MSRYTVFTLRVIFSVDRMWRIVLATLLVCPLLATAQDGSGVGVVVFQNSTGNDNVTLPVNVSIDNSTSYELSPEGSLSINVTEMWQYFVETGEIPVVSPAVADMLSRAVTGLDFTGTFALFRNETFFDRFMEQLGSSFPQWQDWFQGIRDARDQFINPSSSSDNGHVVALAVGISLAVVALIAIIVCVIMYMMHRRRVMNGAVLQRDAGAKVIDVRTFDDSMSLKSATTLALSLPDESSHSLARVNSGEDPVLQWVQHSSHHGLGDGSESSHQSGSPIEEHQQQQTVDSIRSSVDDSIPEFLSNLQFKWEDIKIAKSLGIGACGKVYLARWNETPVAVKVLLDTRELHYRRETNPLLGFSSGDSGTLSSTSHIATANPKRMLEEIKITAALRHPNVVQFMGFCLSPPSMAAEYCPRGSLYNVLHEPLTAPVEEKKPLPWLRRLTFAADGAAGMLHLHSRTPQILHRDLNSPNLLVAADWTVKVADMGLSKLLTDSSLGCGINSIVTSGGGLNPRWLAPEILSGGACTTASDVFSFGVVMWEILTRQVPWEGFTTWAIVGEIQRGDRLPTTPTSLFALDETVDLESMGVYEYVQLMKECWSHAPEERPDFSYIAGKLREIQRRVVLSLSKQ